MNLLPLDILGPREKANKVVQFGIFLPWVSATNGNSLSVKIIHENDQFLQKVSPLSFPMSHSVHAVYGDYWSAEIKINANDRLTMESFWGQPGRYLYRFELRSPLLAEPLDWIADPYAREFGVGRQSAFTLGYEDFAWGATESTWKTPEVKDLIAYEIMLHEFAVDLKGAIAKLPYLRDLGINCMEVMPVANVARSIDWGFEPIGPFGLDERFGKRRDLQEFVAAAHEHGIAVMLDMVYGHMGRDFAYEQVYKALGYYENPFMGSYAKDMFGASVDFRRQFAQDFIFTVNHYWLDRYHVDGIRYDCVPNYYEGCQDQGYSNLVYNTYQAVKATKGEGHWQRFFHGGGVHLIQCAEQLEGPVEIVQKTYSNCTWQNETLNAAIGVAQGDFGRLGDLGLRLGLDGYPEVECHNGDVVLKTALQYLENHDHPRFICRFGTYSVYQEVVREGRREENWFRLQPFVIGLLLAKGVPMLWQGQEIVECYDVPGEGMARIGSLRPVRWEFFYDQVGKSMIRLYRKLIGLRKAESVFRRGSHYFFNDYEKYQRKGLLVFERSEGSVRALVALNFSSMEQSVDQVFRQGGDYVEQLHGEANMPGVEAGSVHVLRIPAHYGRVWMRKP